MQGREFSFSSLLIMDYQQDSSASFSCIEYNSYPLFLPYLLHRIIQFPNNRMI